MKKRLLNVSAAMALTGAVIGNNYYSFADIIGSPEQLKNSVGTNEPNHILILAVVGAVAALICFGAFLIIKRIKNKNTGL